MPHTASRSRYFIRALDARPYSPANHTGTVKVLVIYSPPYGEDPDKVRR